MAKVREIVLLTLMPMSFAAPMSSETARMARPGFVLLTKRLSSSISTTETMQVMMGRDLTGFLPILKSVSLTRTAGNLICSLPKISCAMICSARLTPMAVISAEMRGALRSGV